MAYLATAGTGSPGRAGSALSGRTAAAIGWSWPSTLVVVSLLAAWEVAVRSGTIQGLLAPAPSAIGRILIGLLASGVMPVQLGATLLRVAGGLALGAGTGTVVGLVMGWSEKARLTLDPIVAALHPIPKIALFPLLIVLLGVGERSKVAAISIAAFFPATISTMGGVRAMNPVHLDLARVYGASTWQLFRRVLLPGSLPIVLGGLRIAANVAFLSTIAVEMVAAQTGLGALLWQSWQLFRIEQLYATLLIITFVGIGLGTMIRWVSARSAPWLSERQGAG